MKLEGTINLSGPTPEPSAVSAALYSPWWRRRRLTPEPPVPDETLCAHQSTTDRGSAVNDYTIREEPLKSHTFQFKTHKPSELGPD